MKSRLNISLLKSLVQNEPSLILLDTFYVNCFTVLSNYLNFDQTERHEFCSRLWLFISPFLFPPKKEGRKKGE